MSQIAINTSQNIPIHFAVASIGERILAFIIDMLIKAAFVILLFLLLNRIFDISVHLKRIDQTSAAAIVVFLTLPVYIYTLVLESILEGQTLGKKIMQIKVVKIDGYQASFADYLMRWLFRLVEVFVSSGAIAIICMLSSKRTQRLGDMVSGTAVISLKNKVNISQTILMHLNQDYIPSFPQVIALNDNDVRIIKENYQKALHTNDAHLVSALSNKILSVLKMQDLPKSVDEKQFIHTVLQDYNYYTGN